MKKNIFNFISLLAFVCSVSFLLGVIFCPKVTRKYIELEVADGVHLTTLQEDGVVYIDNVNKLFDSEGHQQETHVYVPYYSSNGKLCKLDEYGDLKEVE